MPNALAEDYSILQISLVQNIQKYDYRLKRYQISYSIVLLYCSDSVNFNELSNCIRCTDRLITLDKYTCAIVFDSTTAETGQLAANNFLEYFKCTFCSSKFFTSIVNSNHYDDVDCMIPELFSQLYDTVENNAMALSS